MEYDSTRFLERFLESEGFLAALEGAFLEGVLAMVEIRGGGNNSEGSG